MNKKFILIFLFFVILFNQILKLSANDDTYINSSNITYNESENIIELADNSKINYKNTNILIDKGIIDYNTNEFEVFGNFYLYEDLTILSGKNLKGNTSLDTFSANNVSYIYNDDLKIDSENIDRNKNLIYFYNNFLTPCDLNGYFNCPTWSLRVDKTEYDIDEDKFTHFDSFLQIADYKVFYLPYFAHYGVKAPRKKGFLTPSLEFTIGGDQGLITPYYIPINLGTDVIFKPKLFFNQNFEFLEKYQLNSLLENKSSGGNTRINIENIKNETISNINTSFRIDTKQIIDKNNIFSASGLYTNSKSTTRSTNEVPISFEEIFLRLESYNFLTKNDFLKTELSSVEDFGTTNTNTIPISPSIKYHNQINKENFSLMNDFNFTILKRNVSTEIEPSESFKILLNNEFSNSYTNKNIIAYNKILLNNAYNKYYFNNYSSLNNEVIKSKIGLSSDINFNQKFLTSRLKFIIPFQLNNTDKVINEDSKSITFNYQNQFADNRFFGNDSIDNSARLVYGLENNFEINKKKLNFKINQSLEANSKSTYANKVNQDSNFSDYAIEAKIDIKDTIFQIDSRLDQDNLSKKK